MVEDNRPREPLLRTVHTEAEVILGIEDGFACLDEPAIRRVLDWANARYASADPEMPYEIGSKAHGDRRGILGGDAGVFDEAATAEADAMMDEVYKSPSRRRPSGAEAALGMAEIVAETGAPPDVADAALEAIANWIPDDLFRNPTPEAVELTAKGILDKVGLERVTIALKAFSWEGPAGMFPAQPALDLFKELWLELERQARVEFGTLR